MQHTLHRNVYSTNRDSGHTIRYCSEIHMLFYIAAYILFILSLYESIRDTILFIPLEGIVMPGCEHTLTCFLRVVQGVSEGEEFALRASSMSRLSWSSFLISRLIDSDQGDLTCGDSCGISESHV